MGSVGNVLMDTLTLGQSAASRKAAQQQQSMLDNMRDQQNAQMAELKKQGTAPTMITPDQEVSENRRKKRLESLRAGLTQTIKTSPAGLVDTGISTSTAKAKLGV